MKKELTISLILLGLIVVSFLVFIKLYTNKTNDLITGAATSESLSVNPNDENSRPEITSKNYVVDIVKFKFIPDNLVIRVGDSVTWVNHDKAKHKVFSGVNEDGRILIDSGFLTQGSSYTQTFDTAGMYHYWSAAWPYVEGKVAVEMPRS